MTYETLAFVGLLLAAIAVLGLAYADLHAANRRRYKAQPPEDE